MGKVLRVDLTTGTIAVQNLPKEPVLRKLWGGQAHRPLCRRRPSRATGRPACLGKRGSRNRKYPARRGWPPRCANRMYRGGRRELGPRSDAGERL